MSMPSSFDNSYQNKEDQDKNIIDIHELPLGAKIKYLSKQQPLVPIGCGLTTVAIILAMKNLRQGRQRNTQIWFRWRVGFQAITLIALVGGSYWYKNENKRIEDKGKINPQLKEMQDKAKRREKLWIEELERRDMEIKERKKRAEENANTK